MVFLPNVLFLHPVPLVFPLPNVLFQHPLPMVFHLPLVLFHVHLLSIPQSNPLHLPFLKFLSARHVHYVFHWSKYRVIYRLSTSNPPFLESSTKLIELKPLLFHPMLTTSTLS